MDGNSPARGRVMPLALLDPQTGVKCTHARPLASFEWSELMSHVHFFSVAPPSDFFSFSLPSGLEFAAPCPVPLTAPPSSFSTLLPPASQPLPACDSSLLCYMLRPVGQTPQAGRCGTVRRNEGCSKGGRAGQGVYGEQQEKAAFQFETGRSARIVLRSGRLPIRNRTLG